MAISLLPSWAQEYRNHALTGNRVGPNLKMFVYLFASNVAPKPNMSKLWIFFFRSLFTSFDLTWYKEQRLIFFFFFNLPFELKNPCKTNAILLKKYSFICMKNAAEAGLLWLVCFPCLGGSYIQWVTELDAFESGLKMKVELFVPKDSFLIVYRTSFFGNSFSRLHLFS